MDRIMVFWRTMIRLAWVRSTMLPDEVERYFKAGHNVVYYCHKGVGNMMYGRHIRVRCSIAFQEAKPIILTFHKGTQRSYIFFNPRGRFRKIQKNCGSILRGCTVCFQRSIRKRRCCRRNRGEAFSVKNLMGQLLLSRIEQTDVYRYGAVLNLIQLQIVTADMFCRYLGY